jgi:hypothetical protein
MKSMIDKLMKIESVIRGISNDDGNFLQIVGVNIEQDDDLRCVIS